MAGDGVALPADVLHLLCLELSSRADFGTLYNCVISSRQLASSGAINALYRISHDSPVKGGASDDASLAVQGQVVQKWSILWRSIIMSALGKTSFQYCRHLRMLDLRDLGYLLEDDKFKQRKTFEHFFAGEMARFHMLTEANTKTRSKTNARRLKVHDIITSIGDVITQQAPLLEALTEPITGDIFSTALLTWAPRLAHLRRLDFWDGRPFADEVVRNLLYVHCPNIDALTVYQCQAEDADQHLAAFISGLPENTLVHFETISDCRVGPETCLALNRHGKSLSLLKLALTEEGVLALAKLQDCISIETLAIASLRTSVSLKETQNDVYLEIIEWLNHCHSLRDVSFKNLVSAPELLTPVFSNNKIQLEFLQINAKDSSLYDLREHHDFHRAMGQQLGLRELYLSADCDFVEPEDKRELLNGLCMLTNLRNLTLVRTSDCFLNPDISQLALHLPHLETLYVGGFAITDSIWDSMSTLRKLTALTFAGVTRFTAEGILDYIKRLTEGNGEMVLTLDMVDFDFALSPRDEVRISEALATQVGGEFRYQLMRDPNLTDYDSEDSD